MTRLLFFSFLPLSFLCPLTLYTPYFLFLSLCLPPSRFPSPNSVGCSTHNPKEHQWQRPRCAPPPLSTCNSKLEWSQDGNVVTQTTPHLKNTQQNTQNYACPNRHMHRGQKTNPTKPSTLLSDSHPGGSHHQCFEESIFLCQPTLL